MRVSLRKMRQRAGLTQKELAERCNVTQSFISQLENNSFNVTIKQVIELAKALRVTPIRVAEYFIHEELKQQSNKKE
ncbi:MULTISPECIES: helix-turn-helix domain-containing protein [Terrisporobacter]|uniref:Helix-turn-helix domain-containing protein n=2 Tax=Terrisporobacter TaxID=1505652 RepID=A0AAX2ZFZ2_9FIRM|nr:helix-turn-helix transcriptional regulator [Terrisporobacter hibernicus]UEL47330.1 helix-turn-helix domain-containing protein [Terrisporobacter hibernicus]